MTADEARALIAEGRKHDETMTQGTAVAGIYLAELNLLCIGIGGPIHIGSVHLEYASAPMPMVAVRAADKPIEEGAICFAITGNEPHSAPDANGVAWMRNNLGRLLDMAELGLMAHERDHRSFTPEQRGLVIDVCHNLINSAIMDAILDPRAAAACRAKEDAIRTLLDHYAKVLEENERLRSRNSRRGGRRRCPRCHQLLHVVNGEIETHMTPSAPFEECKP